MKKETSMRLRRSVLSAAAVGAPFALVISVGCFNQGPTTPGATTVPTTAATTAATTAPTASPTTTPTDVPDNGNPKIPASHKYFVAGGADPYTNCLSCHSDLGPTYFQPKPASHASRTTNAVCVTCHQKAADQTPPVIDMTVAKITTAEKPTSDGVASDAAWSKATEIQIPLKGGINSSETTMKLKAVHDGTDVYFLATWADPTQSFERGPFVKQADGTWKKTSYYPTAYEDKVGFFWHTGTGMDGFKTQGCAVTCHISTANRTRPLKYTDSASDKIDMWHGKMVRMTAVDSVAQIDDQNVIRPDDIGAATWSTDTEKDGGRRGDPKTGGGYKDNPKNADGSPQWMPADNNALKAPPFWLTATQSFDTTKFSAGDKVAAIYVSAFTGDRADLPGLAKWSNGQWTMEWSRKLTPSNTDGRDVIFAAGGTYYMGAAVFDNAQIGHAIQFGVTKVTFAQ